MSSPDTLVQPIVLLVDKQDPAPHADGVKAAALASVLCYAGDLAGGAPSPVWEEWLSGPFTKSVRRADAKTIAALPGLLPSERPTQVWCGKAQALAFRPVSYGDMSRKLTRLQVSGTTLPEVASSVADASPGSPTVVLNSSLGMSTGKAGAQAAHALFAWFLTLDQPARQVWIDAGFSFGLRFEPEETFSRLEQEAVNGAVIRDNGLTETAPNTLTAFVMIQQLPAPIG